MPAPTINVGDLASSAFANAWFLPLAAYRTSTQSVTSSTTLVNDTALSVAVAANAVYHVKMGLLFDGASGGDLKTGFTFPAGATFVHVVSALKTAATAATDDVVFANGSGWGCVGAGTTVGLQLTGLLTTAGSAGTFQLQWAQVASSATATRMFAGSHLVLQRAG